MYLGKNVDDLFHINSSNHCLIKSCSNCVNHAPFMLITFSSNDVNCLTSETVFQNQSLLQSYLFGGSRSGIHIGRGSRFLGVQLRHCPTRWSMNNCTIRGNMKKQISMGKNTTIEYILFEKNIYYMQNICSHLNWSGAGVYGTTQTELIEEVGAAGVVFSIVWHVSGVYGLTGDDNIEYNVIRNHQYQKNRLFFAVKWPRIIEIRRSPPPHQ